VNAKYIVDALGKFLKVFKQKRPEMAAGDWWFHWDNVPWWPGSFEHLPYSPDLAPADFFLFPKVKKELAGLTLTKETFKKEWEGATITLKAADFAMALRRWYAHCENVSTWPGPTLKKAKNKHVSIYNHFFIDVLRVLNKHT
jgi:hypothetical protein